MSGQQTMTRQRMRQIQAEPRQTTRWLTPTGIVTKDGIERFPDALIARAVAAGKALRRNGLNIGWWPELAPLTRAERAQVVAEVAASKAA